MPLGGSYLLRVHLNCCPCYHLLLLLLPKRTVGLLSRAFCSCYDRGMLDSVRGPGEEQISPVTETAVRAIQMFYLTRAGFPWAPVGEKRGADCVSVAPVSGEVGVACTLRPLGILILNLEPPSPQLQAAFEGTVVQGPSFT